MGHKAAETPHSNAFCPGTANEGTVQWWFKKFCKGDSSLENEEHSDWPLEVDNDQLRESLKLIRLQLHEKLCKNSVLTILQWFGTWSKLERWKGSISGWLMKVKVTQSCPTLCDPTDYKVHGILQARILEWVAIPFSRGSPHPRGWTLVSHIAGGFFTREATREVLEYWTG